jgi:hypothetical protein
MQSKKEWTPATRNEYALQYYKDNKGYYKDYYKKYREENKETIKEYQRNYRLEQKARRQEERRAAQELTEADVIAAEEANKNTELFDTVHVRTVTILELNKPLGIEILLTPFFKELKEYKLEQQKPYRKILLCSMTELKEHIESQFKEGMNWKNIDITKIKGDSFHYGNLKPIIKN